MPTYTTIALPRGYVPITGACSTWSDVSAASPADAAQQAFENGWARHDQTVLVVAPYYTFAFKWDVPPTPAPTVVRA